MTDKECIINNLLRLYELQKDSLDKRRGIQWKVSIGFWTLIALATGFLLRRQTPVVSEASGLFFGLIWLVFAIWLLKLQQSHRVDQHHIHRYRQRIEFELCATDEIRDKEDPSFADGLTDLWVLTHSAMTAIFLASSWWLLSRPLRDDSAIVGFVTFAIILLAHVVAPLAVCLCGKQRSGETP